MVEALLTAGADPNARTVSGETPLHLAAAGSPIPSIATLLVNAGADPAAQSRDGNTPLHRVAENTNDAALPIAAALLDAGADPDALNQKETTPLHRVAAFRPTGFLDEYEKIPALIAALVDAGADPRGTDAGGRTPLHLAAAANTVPPIVAALLHAGADPDARDKSGRTPLHLAAAHQHHASRSQGAAGRRRRSRSADGGWPESLGFARNNSGLEGTAVYRRLEEAGSG